MRIVCWNVNGLKTVRAYRPWFNLKDWQACLEHLDADVGCFQEVKATRTNALAMDRDMCKPNGYAAFFNLHPTKGYSGTVTYVSEALGTPIAAEAGITGALVDTSKNKDEPAIGHFPDPRDEPVWDSLDAEGRAVVVDFGLFVLFNLYCPNETDETRREYKMAYNEALQERAYRLLDAGREVIIVGDLNIAHLPIDHCDAVGKEPTTKFLDAHPARAWLDNFLAPNGRFHDVTRERHPTRQGMYTCWNTLIDARPSNYGTRIDFTLVSKGMLPWVKDADISADVYGSDHCPIWLELHEEITDESGQVLKLRELINKGAQKAKLPAMASANWPEFSQRNLKSFFSAAASKQAGSSAAAASAASKVEAKPDEPESSAAATEQSIASTSASSASTSTDAPLASTSALPPQQPSLSDAFAALDEAASKTPPRSLSSPSAAAPASNGASTRASPAVLSASTTTAKAKGDKKKKKGQLKLKAFFTPPPKATPAPAASGSAQASSSAAPSMQSNSNGASGSSSRLSAPPSPSASPAASGSAPDADDATPDAAPSDDPAARVSTSLAWGNIFKPPPAPRCSVHNEPARAWTVNKPGVNQGRKFYMCARPVGPGYEKEGREKVDVDKQYRCGYWKWASDLGSNSKRSAAAAALDEPKSLREVAYSAPALGSGDRRGSSAPKEGDSPHKRVKAAER